VQTEFIWFRIRIRIRITLRTYNDWAEDIPYLLHGAENFLVS